MTKLHRFIILLFITLSLCSTIQAHVRESDHTERMTAEDFLVRGLDEVLPDVSKFEGDMYAGLLPVDHANVTGKLMFWLFAPHQPAVDDSLVIWLNGGPGCSSFMAGVLFETAPITVPLQPAGYCCSDAEAPLQYNPYAWTNATAMLYVEQPVGVGFSYGNHEPSDEADLSDDFYTFLQNFYRVFTKFQDKRLFIVGESYAGMYAPSIAHKVHMEMQRKSDTGEIDDIPIKLAGVGLGNGWVDASVQGPATIDYAYWHGMIDQFTRENLHAEWTHCMQGQRRHYSEQAPFHEFNTPDDCAMMTGVLMAAGQGALPHRPSGPNTYDVTTWDPYAIFHDESSSIVKLFNDDRVKKALHAPLDTEWAGCIPGAGRRRLSKRRRSLGMLEHDQPESTLPYIAELLDAGVRVIAYNGDRDLSTCAQGTEMLLNQMNWSGHDDWKTAPRGLWTVDKEPAGYAKSLKGLDFVVVYNSGHLVPYNQPSNALDLITRFLKGDSFSDYPLPSFDFGYNKDKKQPNETVKSSDTIPTSVDPPMHHNFWLVASLLVAFACGFGTASLCKRKPGYSRI